RYVSGNLLSDDAEVLVNPVNCVGVMGAGLALAFKNAHPAMFGKYAELCRRKLVRPGQVHFIEISIDQVVCNFPTKDHWRDPSQIDWIVSGLKHLAGESSLRGFTSLAVPALGCGRGGLPWAQVKPVIEAEFA